MGYHNDSIKEWYKPFVYKNTELSGTDGHKSCWDCGNIQLRGQFNRRCKIHLEKKIFIWPGDFENEILQDPKDGGKTQADLCEDYFLNSDIEKVLKERKMNERK